MKCMTLEEARARLRAGHRVLDSALETGLPELEQALKPCVELEAASPGEIKAGGSGWTIRAGMAASPFGECLIAEAPRGICHLSFSQSLDASIGWKHLEEEWPNAALIRDDSRAGKWADSIFMNTNVSCGTAPPLRLFVRGTEFQIQVWRTLLQIPAGCLVSYKKLAARIDKPKAIRAVGSAVGRNSVGYLIPCHRVIRENGGIGGYAWGVERKRAILIQEASRLC
ncbi:methylated-DNA--[protein]-cysteine S-methyltransferase [Pontiella agarivorans]|nr:methylated-DNA--[protein]-cysteine S-methyltransferase [Pontiella agarivorans]